MSVHVIGLTGAGLDGLAPSVRALVAEARTVCGGERHLAIAGPAAERILLKGDLVATVKLVGAARAAGSVVVLASGDPLFFGIGRMLLEQIPAEDLVFHPAPSSVQLAFARLKMPWQDAAIVSLHGRPFAPLQELVDAGRSPIAVLTDAKNSPKAIAANLPAGWTIHVCENLDAPDERVRSMAPVDAAKRDDWSPLNVVVLTRASSPAEGGTPAFGIPDDRFETRHGQPGMITKREVRVLTLASLDLRPDSVLYDVGAGTGSVSIEAARLAPSARVFAIEGRAEDVEVLKRNIERFRTGNVTAVAGIAPEALTALPDPTRVFVGGWGGRLADIVGAVWPRLPAGGVVVVNSAQVEGATEAIELLRAAGARVDFLDVSVSRSRPLAGKLAREPLNPVTIVRGVKP